MKTKYVISGGIVYERKKIVLAIFTSVIGLIAGVGSAFAYGTINSGIEYPPLTFTKWNGFESATYTAFTNAAAPWNVVSQGEISKNIINAGGPTLHLISSIMVFTKQQAELI